MLLPGADEARKRLPELLKRAEAGEHNLIHRHSKPIAALGPLHQHVHRLAGPDGLSNR